MNGSVISLSKRAKVHPGIKGNNLITRYVFSEGSFVNQNKAAYLDDKTWAKVVKVVSPVIRKMKVSNVACDLPILLAIYLTLRIRPSNFSADDI